MTAKIIARPIEGSRLPSRIKIGVDLGRREDRLPCNICTNLSVFDPAMEEKKHSFRWSPLLADQSNAFLWIENGSPAIDYRRKARIEVTYYREADCQTICRPVCLEPNEAMIIRVKDDAELVEFFGGLPGWCTLVSDGPYLKGFYFAEHSSGVVGGDHIF